MSKRVVPWMNKKEWKEIYLNLYSINQPELQRKAINRIKAWTSRGRVPHSIEITGLMVEIGLNRQMTESEQKYIYSMAIIRFVNGIVDQGQKGNYQTSAISVAEQLVGLFLNTKGLPIWFVEQRHQATHDKIPSLPYLQKSRLAALEWLRINYWNVQDTAHDSLQEMIINRIKEYKSASASTDKNFKKEKKLVQDIADSLSPDMVKEILIPIFIEEVLNVVDSTSSDKILLSESTISNELKSWKIFIDTCIDSFPNFILLLFECLFTTKPTIPITEWIRHILITIKFSQQETLSLLKICFENEKNQGIKDYLRIIKGFNNIPHGHRYHVLLDYLLGSPMDIQVDDSLDVDAYIDNVKKRLENPKSLPETIPNSKWVETRLDCQVGEILDGEDLDLEECYDDVKWLNDNQMLFIPVEKGYVSDGQDLTDGEKDRGSDYQKHGEEMNEHSELVIY